MFSKHRKWMLTALCLLSALLLSLGQTAFSERWEEWNPAMGTTAPENSSITVTMPTRLTTSEPLDSIKTTQYHETAPTSGTRASGRYIRPFLRAGAFFLGAVLGMLFLMVKQPAALLGPEISVALPVIFWNGFWIPYGLDPILEVTLTWALFALILVCGRELVSWLRNRFSPDWALPHRMGAYISRGGKKRLYLICCLGGVLLALGLILFVVLRGFGYQDFWWYVLWCAAPGILLVMSILCLIRYGIYLEQLSGKIEALHSGREIPVGDGPFRQEEEKLADLGSRMEEAVKTAVTGERFKVELISNVSHDLRTPLTAILGYGELLKGEPLSEEGAKQLQRLNQKAGYMRELLESLFELTKVSSGVLESKQERLDLIRLLEQTLGLFDDQLTGAGLQVKRHYCSEELPVVTDGARMHQVFANLLGNAIKYALSGTRIHLEVRNEERIRVRMANIASYEMDFTEEEILQRFARGDRARSTGGSGIGLAIAQTYTESVGGSFHIQIDGDLFSAVVELPKTERES